MGQTCVRHVGPNKKPRSCGDLQGRGLRFDAVVRPPDYGVTVKVMSSVVISPPSWARQRST